MIFLAQAEHVPYRLAKHGTGEAVEDPIGGRVQNHAKFGKGERLVNRIPHVLISMLFPVSQHPEALGDALPGEHYEKGESDKEQGPCHLLFLSHLLGQLCRRETSHQVEKNHYIKRTFRNLKIENTV